MTPSSQPRRLDHIRTRRALTRSTKSERQARLAELRFIYAQVGRDISLVFYDAATLNVEADEVSKIGSS